MWEFLAAVVSAVVALIGLMVAWRKGRETALRKEEVQEWSNDVIRNMQTLALICQREVSLSPEAEQAKLSDIYFETSVLAEQGRMFFKNQPAGDYGRDKPEAYRGKRPEILDQVLIAHAVAGAVANASVGQRDRMRCVAHDAARRFVSLAQKEVGRSRTASAETRKGGKGSSLEALMQGVAPERLVSANT